VREIVAYAATRYVTVVPEIEGPGHSVEMLAAYPFLACAPGPFATMKLWGSTKYSACPTARTFAFYDGVIREVAQLFPSPVIHVGGDEVPYFSWRRSAFVGDLMQREGLQTYSAVQAYFTRRIETIARKYHRRIVGWDEIESAGVSRDAVVMMAWSGNNAGVVASQHGNDVVMTPRPVTLLRRLSREPALRACRDRRP
jgi:hexosaminidase